MLRIECGMFSPAKRVPFANGEDRASHLNDFRSRSRVPRLNDALTHERHEEGGNLNCKDRTE